MKDFALPPMVKEGFSIVARATSDGIFLKVSGNGDMETPASLAGYLRALHTEAVRLSAGQIVVECEDLYFMSSACVKCLVTWLDGIQKLEDARRYAVRFRANPNLHWQRRSFEALRRFAPGIVRVD
jgi:hypothetical protein